MGYNALGDYVEDGETPAPVEEEELSPQEKLKLELQQLNAAQTSVAPARVQLTPEQIAVINKAQPTPVKTEDAPVTMDPDTPQLEQPDYADKPDAKIRMLSTKSAPGKTFSPEVESAMDRVMHLYPNMNREQLGGFIQVESSGDPRSNINKGTQYKGLLQIGRDEWRRHGGGGDIYDAEQNLKGGASLMEENRRDFVRNFKREPTAAELYIMHQQGLGFFTKGKMTNIVGNLPPDARTPENMTWEGFKNWWTARINRAIAQRGTAPTMRIAQDSGLPNGFLYPGAFADVGGKELTQGGLADTPEAQGMIAELMQGKPLAQQGGTERATREAMVRAARDPNMRTRTLPRVPTSRERMQVRGNIPGSVSNTDPTLGPIPGINTPGQQALIDAANPSMLSTMMNHQVLQAEQAPPPMEVKQPVTAPTSLMDKLKSVIASLTPDAPTPENAMRSETIKALLNKPSDMPWSEIVKGAGEDFRKFDEDITKGGVAGIASMPGQLLRGIGGAIATPAGQVAGYEPLEKWGIETTMAAQQGADAWRKEYKVDPNNKTQMAANWIGENFGKSPAGTLLNLALSSTAEKVLPPTIDYLGKNYPIPNLMGINPAQAATVFGKPPLVINTPAGPLVMNDADRAQFAWGGVLMVGFGSSIPVMSSMIRGFRTWKAPGLDGVFDPRRPIPGTTVEAASIPADLLKGGILDQGKALLDVAIRQAKYEKGNKVGIDPLAANEVLQHWRVQTNSGAQNLIRTALLNGDMQAPEYRFNVKASISKLAEFGAKEPNFIEYIRLKAIEQEINLGVSHNRNLPSPNSPRLPETFNDPSRPQLTWDRNGVAQVLSDLNRDPRLAQMYRLYQENLIATRDFVTQHPDNALESRPKLDAHALKNTALPVFSAVQSRSKLFNEILRGDNPLEVAERNMSKVFEKQLKLDAEQRYIKMTEQSVGSKAFLKAGNNWIGSPEHAKADQVGAVLTRRLKGETVHYTADPFIVSVMNSGHIPLGTTDSFFATTKGWFQKTTTGAFAPWFAPTGMIRSMEQGWTTAPGGMKTAGGRTVLPAGPISTTMGILSRTGAQMSRPTAQFFRETMAGQALAKMLTPGQGDLLARSFEKWYMDSYYRRMEVAGAFSGDSVMEGKAVYESIAQARKLYSANPHMNPVVDYMNKAHDAWNKFLWDPAKKALYKPLNEGLTIIQEGPAYGYARKVMKGSDDINRPTQTIKGQSRVLSDAEIAEMAFKNYTGNPATRGYAFDKSGKPLRFLQGGLPPRQLNAAQTGAQHVLRATWGPQVKAYSLLAQGASASRAVTPWAGVLFQSPSATLAAMRDNPVRANMAFAVSAIAPEMAAYMWNSYWSGQPVDVLDDQGQPVRGADGKRKQIKYDYVNYMMNLRNTHNLMNNVYFAVPGKKPNEGWEARHYQETAMSRYMARSFMHQFQGKAAGNMYEDSWEGLKGFMNVAVIPPMPSAVGVYLGSKGMVSTGGWTGGLFKSRENPFIDIGGGESGWELAGRAALPSLSDIMIQAMTAGMHAPDWYSVPGAVASQVGKRIIGRTAVLGDLAGIHPDVSGAPVISDELWANKKIIDDLMYRYRVWDQKQGAIDTNKGSKQGRAYVADYMDDLPPSAGKNMIANPGLQQKPPTNPLYIMMMEEMEKTFGKDEPKKGGMGYKSMWGHYGIYGQEVSRMRTVDDGNAGVWVAKQLKDPETMQWLRERNVNPLDYKDVKNFYQTKRNQAALKILNTIRATEQRFNEDPKIKAMLKGKPFKISMLDPDQPGIDADRQAERATDTE